MMTNLNQHAELTSITEYIGNTVDVACAEHYVNTKFHTFRGLMVTFRLLIKQDFLRQ